MAVPTTKERNTRNRNEYQRKAQKRYRKERTVYRVELRQRAMELEAQLQAVGAATTSTLAAPGAGSESTAIHRRTYLGGHEIAHVRHQEPRQAVLIHDLDAQFTVLSVANRDSVVEGQRDTCLRHGHETWQHVSLLEDPAARRLGFDWITQQLYHNSRRIFASNGFPATHDLFFSVDLGVDDQFKVLIRHQRVVNVAFEDVTAAYRRFFIDSNGFGYALLETNHGDETALHKMNMVYRRRNSGNPRIGDVVQNYLHRQFVDENRSMLVARNILSDDKNPLGLFKRDAAGWIVVERISDTTTLVKECWTIHSLMRGNEFATWQEEEAFYNLDLRHIPEHLQFAEFQQAVFRQGQSVLQKRNDFFHALLS
ncbi:unnamed protein product [Aphanomyces euteiches]|uniref:BZIP domain-containing protein n=1 Tax=Aphanomyces euteiches TaxID=100861 RepID=A0A6G0WIS5_9STRA|nr:hypothetical protein Ae201684_014766 [Aphanomyces euteiches]KAH9078807.1 hypothetical protein Ae201684P_019878 [Aphanomyces euteiches]KAH9138725.1 hypothetical protein AeRB84_016972 [Aphanomyces euteiches]